MKMKKTNLIKDKTYQFALDIIKLYLKLREQKSTSLCQFKIFGSLVCVKK